MAKSLRRDAQRVAAAGRYGDNGVKDTQLIHVNEDELPIVDAVMKMFGGAGTINPETDLLEYRPTGSWGGGSGPSGAKSPNESRSRGYDPSGRTSIGKNSSRPQIANDLMKKGMMNEYNAFNQANMNNTGTPTPGAPTPVGWNGLEWSPEYNLTDYDRLIQALNMASSIATGGVLSGLGGLALSEMNFDPLGLNPDGMTPPRGWSQDPSKGISAGARGTNFKDLYNYMQTGASPQQTAAPTPAGPLTAESLMNRIRGTTGLSDLYYLQQMGLVPMDASGVPDEWKPVFDREFDRVKGTIPLGVIPESGTFGSQSDYDQALQQIAQLFPSTFGQNALTAEQDRRRNEYKGNVSGLGLEGQVSSAFGDTADDAILQSIYDSQYNPARQQIENAYKRGALNQSGLNFGLNKLNEQGKAGMASLQSAGGAKRASLSGELNDYVKSIYDKAGQYTLTDSPFDPSSMATEFGNRLNTAKTNLEGSLDDNVPNIFNVSSALQGAGSVQGSTSRGGGAGLLDTLAGRQYQRRSSQRGLGSTGAF